MNSSKKNDPRMWAKWSRSGAVASATFPINVSYDFPSYDQLSREFGAIPAINITAGTREVVLVTCDRETSIKETLDAMEKRGLLPATAEEKRCFLEQHPEQAGIVSLDPEPPTFPQPFIFIKK